jgi:hypothetical protein
MRQLFYCTLLVIFAQGNVAAEDNPLGFVIPYDWAEFTDREKELYVSGVIDGQIFLLYGASNPELDRFLKCVKKEGIKSIVNFTELHLALGNDIEYPMPWAISVGIGNACNESP